MGGKSKKTTIGYRYYMGIHMALARGPVDEVVEIRVGDKMAWAGRVRDNKDIYINQPDLFGGDDKEGGIQGTLSIMMGAPTQPVHPGLASMLGGLVPAFRGVATAFFDGLICAMSPYPKTWAWRIRRTQKGWHQGQTWYPEKAKIVLGVPNKLAVYFALDQSGSMNTVVGSGTRLSVMKAEIIDCLNEIAANVVGAGSAVDIAVVGFSSPASGAPTIIRRNASIGDIEAIKSFVQGIGIAGGTYWPMGLEPMKAFFAGANAEATKIGFLVTDGEPIDGNLTADAIAAESAQIVAALPADVTVYGVNIDLANTSYTARVDNSGEPVAVVSAGNEGELARSILTRVGDIHAMNPAHILYQAYTDPRMGRGLPASRLDDAAWRVAADTFSGEGMGLCLKWTRADAIEKFAQSVVDHAGASVYTSRRTGKIVLLPIRGGYDTNDLPLFTFGTGLLGIDDDESTSQANSANEVVVKFRDPVAKQDKSVRVKNLGAIHASGGVTNTTTTEYFGIPTASLATRVAQRDMKASSGFIKRFKVRLDRRGGDIMPGGLFRISEPGRGISNMVLRAGNCDYGTLTNGTVTITAVQDAFGLPATSFVAVEPPAFVAPDTAPPVITERRVMEVPYRELVQRLGQSDVQSLDNSSGFLMAMAVQPSALSQSFDLMTNAGGDFTRKDDAGAFCPSGKLKAAVDALATVIELSSATRLSEVALGSAALIDDEIVRVDVIDLAASKITLGRGCADTVPAAHAKDARVFFFDDFSSVDSTEYTAGVTANAKLLTRTASGVLGADMAPSDALVFGSRAARPYPPAGLKVNGMAVPAEPIKGKFTLSWVHRNRLTQADQLVDALAGSLTPEEGVTYALTGSVNGQELLTQSAITGHEVEITMPGNGVAKVIVRAECLSLQSWQAASISFDYLGALAVTGVLPAMVIGKAYSGSLQGSGGTPPYTWSLGTGFPPGISIDAATGAMRGTPTTAGQYSFDVTVTDSASASVVSHQTVEVFDDAYWSKVRSLLHFDGTNASTVMKDEKGKVWTANAGAKLDTAQAKFGGASLLLNGTTDYLSTPYVAGHFDPVNDHTIEAWVRPSSSKRHTLYDFSAGSSGSFGHYCAILANGRFQAVYGTSAGWSVAVTTNSVPLNEWTHLAITKSGNVVRLFIGGVLQITHTLAGRVAPNAAPPVLGKDGSDATRHFQGWVDDFRYTDGVARYIANFTPPAGPYPNGGA